MRIGKRLQTDGLLHDFLEGEVLLSIDAIKKTGQFSIEAVNLSAPGSVMENIRANLSPEGQRKWYEAIIECRKKLRDFAATEKGEIAAIATLLVAPFGVDHGAGQNFETRVNNYRKAYDLDQETAKKVAMVAHLSAGGYQNQERRRLRQRHWKMH
jgi:hypothetical protein